MTKYGKRALLMIFLSAFISEAMGGTTEYLGTVTPMKVVQHGAGTNAYFYGSLAYVARIGEIALPSITDADGNVIKQGTVLYRLNMEYWQKQLEGAKNLLLAANIMVKESKKNLLRYESLVKPGAASEEVYEGYISKYSDALNNLKTCMANVIQADEFLKAAELVSPFECIVSKVMYSQGITAENESVIEITQLNPIGISVVMPREEARKIGMNKPVKIFPMGSDKPQGILYGRTLLTDTGLTFLTQNTSVISKEDRNIRIHRDCLAVIYFSVDGSENNMLGVSRYSILKDSLGTFVWLADNVRTMNPGEGIDDTFKVEKAYVKLAGLNRLNTGYTTLEALSDHGKLQRYDLVLNNPPPDLKEGELIYFPQERYVLMPGDQVKVVIGK